MEAARQLLGVAMASHWLLLILFVAAVTAGATRYSFRKFIIFTFAGVTIAYTYVALLGYLGGDAFAHDSLKALGFSLSLAFTIGLVIETSRRIAVKRKAAKVSAG